MPCDAGHSFESVVTTASFENNTFLEVTWDTTPVPALSYGGGRALIRSVAGEIEGMPFLQSDPMKIAGDFELNSLGLAGAYGTYTGLSDPAACIVWLNLVPGGFNAHSELDLLSCDFAVTKSLKILE